MKFKTAVKLCEHTVQPSVRKTARSLKDFFSLKFIACMSCSRTNNKTVPLTNLNKYLYNGNIEIEVNINNCSKKP